MLNFNQSANTLPLHSKLQEKHESVDLKHCCSVEIHWLAKQGYPLASHAGIVTKWYRHFWKHLKFVLPLNRAKDNLPLYLHANPDVCIRIKTYYTKENLETLSIEVLSEFIHHKCFPCMYSWPLLKSLRSGKKKMTSWPLVGLLLYLIWTQKVSDKIETNTCPRRTYLCQPQHSLLLDDSIGISICHTEQGYYVDGHERPATIQYRWEFCKWCPTYKQRMNCWIQVTLTDAAILEENGDTAKGSGYRQGNIIECHVDTVNPKKLKEPHLGEPWA